MNRQEFFRRLEYLLRGIPESERMDALAYYNDYFDEAGVENEQKVMQELGSPEQVAQIILDDYYRGQQGGYDAYGSPEMDQENQNRPVRAQKRRNTDKSARVLLIILLVITCPIWIGVLAGLFGGIVGILGGLFGCAVGFLVGGAVCFGKGVMMLFTVPAEGLVTVAVGAVSLAGFALTLLLLVLLFGKWIPKLVRAFVSWIRGLLGRQEGGDEI